MYLSKNVLGDREVHTLRAGKLFCNDQMIDSYGWHTPIYYHTYTCVTGWRIFSFSEEEYVIVIYFFVVVRFCCSDSDVLRQWSCFAMEALRQRPSHGFLAYHFSILSSVHCWRIEVWCYRLNLLSLIEQFKMYLSFLRIFLLEKSKKTFTG